MLEVQRGRLLMGSACRITAFGPHIPATARAIEAALDRIQEAEALLSTWRDDTELARLNREAPRRAVPVSPELRQFLQRVLALAESTAGAFDPSVGALVDAWALRGAGKVPSPEELQQARRAVGFQHVHLEADSLVRFRSPGLWLDSGASGKGYALERAAQTLQAQGVRAALLDFGGQILAMGAPPGEPGWTVAVADPQDRRGAALILLLRDVSVATSSQWERGRQVQGRWIGHILDPRTGQPIAWQGSTTVIAARALEADALATGLFVLGPVAGLEWAGEDPAVGVAFLSPAAGVDGAPSLRLQSNAAFRRVLSGTRDDVLDPDVPQALEE
jgi:thiamine biosynthesis lipoprotein